MTPSSSTDSLDSLSIGYDSNGEGPSEPRRNEGDWNGHQAVDLTRAASGSWLNSTFVQVSKSVLYSLLFTGLILAVVSVAIPILAAVPLGLPLAISSIVFGAVLGVAVPVAFQILFCEDS